MPLNSKRADQIAEISRKAREAGIDQNGAGGGASEGRDFDIDLPKPINLEEETQRYTAITTLDGIPDGLSPRGIGIWVKVPLPAYKGMAVLFKTSNRTAVRLSIPQIEPEDFSKLDNAMEAARAEVEVYMASHPHEPNEELPADESAEIDRLMAIFQKASAAGINARLRHMAENRAERAPWLAKFVIDFYPWPFDIEKPDPRRPETYVALAEEFEDLFDWLIGLDGYNEALAEAAKNS